MKKEETELPKPLEVISFCALSDVFSDINANGISDVLEKRLRINLEPKAVDISDFMNESFITLVQNLKIDRSDFNSIVTEAIDFIYFMYPDRVLVASCPLPGQYRGTSPVVVAPKPGCTLHFCAFGELEETPDHQNESVTVRIANYSYFGSSVLSNTYLMNFLKQNSEYSLQSISMER